MTGEKQTVLITGASSGIGLELSRIFAKNGFNLILVSRDEFTLNEVAEELRDAGAGKVSVFAKDLSFPKTAEELYLETTMAGLKVDILVNDAGVAQHGNFSETPLEKDYEIIHLNITSLVTLTKLYLQPMLERKSGRILQLASIASYMPIPLLAVYAASKAFVLSFTDSLINELQDTGVTVTALIPGATDTGFFRNAGMEDTKAAQEDPDNPAHVAQIGFDALMAGKEHATPSGIKPQIILSALFPNKNLAAAARKQVEKKDPHNQS